MVEIILSDRFEGQASTCDESLVLNQLLDCLRIPPVYVITGCFKGYNDASAHAWRINQPIIWENLSLSYL